MNYQQMMPAGGWVAAFKVAGSLETAPLAMWVLTEEGEVEGLAWSGLDATSESSNFYGWFPSEEAAQAQWREEEGDKPTPTAGERDELTIAYMLGMEHGKEAGMKLRQAAKQGG